MQRGKKYRRAAISALVALPLGLGPLAGARPAFAQTPPACPPGYYFASDGYCYPSQPPVYAYPPPVYDATPPVYQPPPVVDGLAIGVGLGLLFGALAAGQSGHGDGRDHGGPPPRGASPHAPPRGGAPHAAPRGGPPGRDDHGPR